MQPQQPRVPRLGLVAQPDAAHAARTHLVPLQSELVRHPLLPPGRVLECVLEDLCLDLGRDAVGVRAARTALLLDQRVHAADLERALDLVERVAVVAHDLAGLGHVPQFLGELSNDNFLRVLCGRAVIGCASGEWVSGDSQSTRRAGWPLFCFQGAVQGATVGCLLDYLTSDMHRS